MSKLTVKDALAALKITRRLQKVLGMAQSKLLQNIMSDRAKEPQPVREPHEQKMYELGYKEGLNDGCRVANLSFDDLGIEEVISAAYGPDDDAS